MPELPDITVYIEALEERIGGASLKRVELLSPFLLRTVTPPLARFEGMRVRELRRVGKRIVFGFEGELWLVIHLMIAGRLHWEKRGAKPQARFEFSSGTLTLTEAGSQRRASLHAFEGAGALAAVDPGGIEVMSASAGEFHERLIAENHTVKRALTDPRLFSGIGNAYSDEILHRARMSPVMLTSKMGAGDSKRLHEAAKAVLEEWVERLRTECGKKFPQRVTAFRDEMAVHGRYGQPCPDCGTKVQRIRYASNETNYCPRCQTGGRLLADRALSRLLGKDWPKSIDELS